MITYVYMYTKCVYIFRNDTNLYMYTKYLYIFRMRCERR
jgi:hypothetical protein